MLQTEAYLTILIYYCKTFILQATGVFLVHSNFTLFQFLQARLGWKWLIVTRALPALITTVKSFLEHDSEVFLTKDIILFLPFLKRPWIKRSMTGIYQSLWNFRMPLKCLKNKNKGIV